MANIVHQQCTQVAKCVVLAGLKLIDLHKAQANVGPHKKERICVLAGTEKSSWEIGH